MITGFTNQLVILFKMDYHIYFWVEVSTLLICFFCYRKFNSLRYRLFLPYLATIVLYEFGTIHGWFAINGTNAWITNLELIFEYLFYSYFIISSYQNKKYRRALLVITLVCLLFTTVDIIWLQGLMQLGTIAILVQYSLLIALVCCYFYLKMRDDDRADISLLKQPDFWVHTGLLFFFLSEFLFFASYTSLAYKRLHSFHILFMVISNVAILILYGCLSISFICSRQIQKAS